MGRGYLRKRKRRSGAAVLLSDGVCRFLRFNPERSVGEMAGVFTGATEDEAMEGCATVNNRIKKEGSEEEREIERGREGGGEQGYGSLLRN